MIDPLHPPVPAPDLQDLSRRGLQAFQKGLFEEASEAFGEWAMRAPQSAEPLYFHGYALLALGEWQAALDRLDAALAVETSVHAIHMQRALALTGLKRLPEALMAADQALAMAPADPEALVTKARVLLAMDRLDDAIAAVWPAVNAAPGNADILAVAGDAVSRKGHADEAASLYAAALALKPAYPNLLASRALALERRGHRQEALALCRSALAMAPDTFDALNVMGAALIKLKRYAEAAEAYRRAAEAKPDNAEAWCSLGAALFEADRLNEADVALTRALQLKPGFAVAASNHAYVLARLRTPERAAEAFSLAASLTPDKTSLLSGLRFTRAQICDWRDREEMLAAALVRMEHGEFVIDPFESLVFFEDPLVQRRVAAIAGHDGLGDIKPANPSPRTGDKIRIGYLSADFRDHPVAQLMEDILEGRDRSAFEIIAFSIVSADQDPVQQHLRSVFDEFHDVSKLDIPELAEFLASKDIEILVDLSGFTDNGRVRALAHRPAPVQVNFLGFSGTLGVDYVDYIVGDPILMPVGSEPFYSENIVRLADCYMPNSRRRMGAPPTREACGLPAQGVVFCSFSSGYKITPKMFGGWMRILSACPDSVLWLPDREGLKANLVPQAQAHGIAPERLIFAPLVPTREEHLARLSLADIMLDTFPYGAHTTAGDGLWAGVPVVTIAGSTFASRVAASLVAAVGVPELDRTKSDDYEAFAIRLAHDPEGLAALKARLISARETSPLFDPQRFTRNLEAAFREMSARSRRGEAPASFDVPQAAG